MIGLLRRHRVGAVLVGLLILGGVSVPIVAFFIVPQLVRSTLVEDLPTTAPAVSGGSAPAGTPVTLLSGDLVRISAADYGSGQVRIVRIGTDRFLRFENVDIAGAPDMFVYLSDRNDGKPGTFVDLGRLKATNGSFNYAIPTSVDLGAVRSVVIWCRQFTVTITYAAFG